MWGVDKALFSPEHARSAASGVSKIWACHFAAPPSDISKRRPDRCLIMGPLNLKGGWMGGEQVYWGDGIIG